MEDQKRRSTLGLFLLVLIFFVGFFLFAFLTMGKVKQDITGESQNKNEQAPIAVVEVKGIILDSKKVIEKLHQARDLEQVKAIIIRIDSPGGAVGPTQEIYQEMIAIDKDKPIYASFGSIAASGGYYLGAAARRIYSNPGTLTGSIGVIMEFVGLSELYKFIKINPEVIKSGEYKDIGHPHRSMTPKERALLTDLTQDVHARFKKDIISRRKHLEKSIDGLAQGQIFTGEKAKELGLVDELAGLWEAGRQIHQELGFKESFGLKFIKEKKPFSYLSFFEGLEGVVSNIIYKTFVKSTPMFLYKP